MRGRLLGAFGLALGMTCANGCSSDGDDNAAGSPDIDEVPELFAVAVCDAVETCLGPLVDIFLAGDDCVERTQIPINDELGRIKTAVDEGRIIYRGDRLQDCLDELSALGCEFQTQRESPACQAAIDGTIAVGDDCMMSLECEGNAYCKVDGMCPGVCSALESAGGACTEDDECAPGLVCSEDTSRCVEPVGEGASCGAGIEPPCEPSFLCVGDDPDMGMTGTCQTVSELFSAGSGQPCDVLEGPYCDTDLHCAVEGVDMTTGSLVAACRAEVGSGAACNLAIPDMCPEGEYCAVDPNQVDGTCTALPAAGEPCADSPVSDTGLCQARTTCENGMCRNLQRLGGSCEIDAVCYSERCVGGACVPGGACE